MFRDSLARAFLALTLVSLFLTSASAQCLDWASGFGLPGNGISGTDVKASIVYDDGTGPAIYVVGTFASAGSVTCHNVGRWDGASWTAVGDLGANAVVECIAVYDDGSGPALIAGGYQMSISGGPNQRLVKWTLATGWQPFAVQPSNGEVTMLGVYDLGAGPRLCAGGSFTSIGALSATRIASFDGSTWSAMGSGFDQVPLSLVTYDWGAGPRLIVGGNFAFSGATLVGGMAVWDGAAWNSPIGGRVTGAVYSFAEFDDGTGPRLFVGGGFSLVNNIPSGPVVRWDGATWSQIGTPGGPVKALQVFDDGTGPSLFVGGSFTYPGSAPAGNIRAWNSAGWRTVGLGVSNQVNCLSVYIVNGIPSLFAAGLFNSAGQKPSKLFAQWGVPCTAPIVLQQPTPAVAVFPQDAVFTIVADGTGPLTYQWRRNATPLADVANIVMGTQTNLLRLVSWSYADIGQYDCVVTGPLGSTISDAVTFTVPAGGMSGYPISLTLVQRTGDAAPVPPGGLYTSLDAPMISGDGSLALYAIANSRPMVLAGNSSQLDLVAYATAAAVGVSGAVYANSDFPSTLTVSDGGSCAFDGALTGAGLDGTNSKGLWALDVLGTTLIARMGDAAPGAPSGYIYAPSGFTPRTSASGRTAFSSRIKFNGANQGFGIWSWERSSGTALLARVGATAPGVGQPWTAVFWPGAIGSTGTIAFDGLAGGVDGIWAGTPSALQLVIQSGQSIPGSPIGETVSSWNARSLVVTPNDDVIAGVNTTANSGSYNGAAVVRSHAGLLQTLARRGDSVPGAQSGATFYLFDAGAGTASGASAFYGQAINGGTGPNKGVWYSSSTGTVSPILLNNSTPPEAPPGFTLTDVVGVSMNAQNQAVVQATFYSGSTYPAVYGWTPGSGPFPIAVPGTQIEVTPGEFKTVRFGYLPNVVGLGDFVPLQALTEDGTLSLMVVFTDYSRAVFLARFAQLQSLYHAPGNGYCFGDGTGTACPCGNVGLVGRGCANSLFGQGALLSSSGIPSLSDDTVRFDVTQVPNSSCLFFQGTARVLGGAGTVFGDGLRCAGGAILRLATRSAGANQCSVGAGIVGDTAIHVRGQVVAPGTRTYQAWYRNAAAFCTSSTYNLSNGIEVQWVP